MKSPYRLLQWDQPPKCWRSSDHCTDLAPGRKRSLARHVSLPQFACRGLLDVHHWLGASLKLPRLAKWAWNAYPLPRHRTHPQV